MKKRKLTKKERKANEWLSKFLKRVNEEPQDSPEEIARSKAERENAIPVKYRTVWRDKDGTIRIKMNQWGPSGIIACGGHTFKPGDEYYEEALRDYSYLKPGESHSTVEKLINGQWVEQEPEKQSEVA